MGKQTATDVLAQQVVMPAIVYQDHIYLHYKDRQLGYVIVVRPANVYSVRITHTKFMSNASNYFESAFIRDRVLVLGTSTWGKEAPFLFHKTEMVHYLSPSKLCEAKWVHVEPSGEITQKFLSYDYMWGRGTGYIFTDDRTGKIDIVHTAVAADGPRDWLVFDLLRTVPAEGKPAPPARIKVMRLTPEKTLTGEGKAEEKVLGEMPTAFDEPFQAYVLGEDYYFLTRSGFLYCSPKPDEGKPRAMTAIWGKTKPRIQFIISDGNKPGAHFLITPREEVGWDYFRLGPDPKPQELDASHSHKNDSPPEAVYWLARELRDKKLIVAPPKKP